MFSSLFGKPPPPPPPPAPQAAPVFDPRTASLAQLEAESHRLAAEQDAIKAKRRELAMWMDRRVREGAK